MLGKISILGNALNKQQAHVKLLSFTAYTVCPLSKEAGKRKPCDGRSDLHWPEQTGAVAAALDTGMCRPAEGCSGIALWDASCCSLPRNTPAAQAHWDTPDPQWLCPCSQQWHSWEVTPHSCCFMCHCLLAGKKQTMSSVGLLPPLGCQNGVQNSRSIRQNPYHCHLCLASYKYQKKGPETSGHCFVSEQKFMDILEGERISVCGTHLLKTLWVENIVLQHHSAVQRLLPLHKLWHHSSQGLAVAKHGQVLLCPAERDGPRQLAVLGTSPAKSCEKWVRIATPVNRHHLIPYLFSSPNSDFPWPAALHLAVPSCLLGQMFWWIVQEMFWMLCPKPWCKIRTAGCRNSGWKALVLQGVQGAGAR